MKRIIMMLTLMLTLTFTLSAADKAMGDSAFANEKYAEAAKIYLSLTSDSAESAALYYNIGNCYYRMDSIAKAVLYYEKARLLDPADKDIRSNLELARTKTVDKVAPANDIFFVTFFRTLMLSMSVQGWAVLGVVTFLMMLLAIGAYLYLPTLLGKKIGFWIALVALVVCIFANISAFKLQQHIDVRNTAVIMSPSVVIKSTPSASGLDLFILHEGTTIQILDNTMKEWVEIHLSDGKEGWMPRADIAII